MCRLKRKVEEYKYDETKLMALREAANSAQSDKIKTKISSLWVKMMVSMVVTSGTS